MKNHLLKLVVGSTVCMVFMFSAQAGPTFGDFNGDGVLDTIDIDMLVGGIIALTYDPSLDINADGMLDVVDIPFWLLVGAQANGFVEPYLQGDTNLDGTVDSFDLNILTINVGTSPNTWSGADFNASGLVNSDDYNLLLGNYGKTIAKGPVTIPIPAPGAILLGGIGVGVVSWLRRRRTF